MKIFVFKEIDYTKDFSLFIHQEILNRHISLRRLDILLMATFDQWNQFSLFIQSELSAKIFLYYFKYLRRRKINVLQSFRLGHWMSFVESFKLWNIYTWSSKHIHKWLIGILSSIFFPDECCWSMIDFFSIEKYFKTRSLFA